jgi:hypothetical protein
MHLPSWVGDGYLTVGGGITNGLPNSSLGGGANYFAGEITPEYFLAEHTSDPDPFPQYLPSFYDEEWFYAQQVDYSVDVSDSYTVDVDDVSLNPQLTVVSASNILLNTDEANWPYVRALADSIGFIEASISYTVTPNY